MGWRISILALLLAPHLPRASILPLALDPDFRPVFSREISQLEALALTPEGQIYISGNYDLVNGTPAKSMVRLNQDGSRDLSFFMKMPNTRIHPVLVDPDGRILVRNDFASSLHWVSPDGVLGNRFPFTVSSLNGGGRITHVERLSSGKLMVGGSFDVAWGGDQLHDVGGLLRLNTDGTVDPTFHFPPKELWSETLFDVFPDGSSIVSTRVDSQPLLLRLNPGGTSDNTFQPPLDLPRSFIVALEAQPDGKVWVGGSFVITGHPNYTNLVRLNSDGSLDTTVSAFPNVGRVSQIQTETTGSILVLVNIPNSKQYGIMRISQTGAVLYASGPIQVPGTLYPLPGGKILSFYGFRNDNHFNQDGLVRLNIYGSLDPTFKLTLSQSGHISHFIPENDGSVVVAGVFDFVNGVPRTNLVRLLPDGSTDQNFVPMLADTSPPSLLAQPSITLGSFFEGGYFEWVTQVSPLSDNQYLVAGRASLYPDQAIHLLVRLHPSSEPFVPRLLAPLRQEDGTIRLRALTLPGIGHAIDVFRDVQDTGYYQYSGWQTVTNLLGDGSIVEIDVLITPSLPAAFYRLRLP